MVSITQKNAFAFSFPVLQIVMNQTILFACLNHMEFGATLNQRSKWIPYFAVLLVAMLSGSCMESSAQLSGLHITEVMPRNGASLFDEWGETPDWVEITNFSGAPINLRDHGLSNDPDQAFLYRFPHFTLESGKRVIVFCSGRQSRRVTKIRNLDLVKPVVEGELLHLDAANPESFILHDNGHIQTWLDQSGATHHASQLESTKSSSLSSNRSGPSASCLF